MSNQTNNDQTMSAAARFEAFGRRLLRPDTLAIAASLLLALCAFLYAYADRPVVYFFDETLSKPAYQLWRDITKVGDSKFYFAVALILLLGGRTLMFWTAPNPIAGWYANLARLGWYLTASFASAGLVVHAIKRLLGRPRPKTFLSEDEYSLTFLTSEWTYNSFPSGHAQTIFVFATILTFFLPRYWWAFYGGAVVIAFSRVIINAHYLSDIIFGSFVGLTVALFVKFRWFNDITELNYRPSHFYRQNPVAGDSPEQIER